MIKLQTLNSLGLFLIILGYQVLSFGNLLLGIEIQNSLLLRIILISLYLLIISINLRRKICLSKNQKLLITFFVLILIRVQFSSIFGYESTIISVEKYRLFGILLYNIIGFTAVIFIEKNYNSTLLDKLIYSFTIVSIIYLLFNMPSLSNERGVLSETLNVAQTSFIALIVTLYSFIQLLNKRNRLHIIIFSLGFYVLLITQSRISLLTAVIFILYNLYYKNKTLFYSSIVILFSSIPFIISNINLVVIRRISELAFYNSRIELFQYVLNVIKENFFFGNGYSFPIKNDQIYYAHNIILDTIHMTGIIGLCIITILLVNAFKRINSSFISPGTNDSQLIRIIGFIVIVKLFTSSSILFEGNFFFILFIIFKNANKFKQYTYSRAVSTQL